MTALAVGDDSAAAKLRIRTRRIKRLVADARNARTHSDAQVAQIAASIRRFGFCNPVLLAEDGTIIAGHARVLAAERMGLASVPTISLSHLTTAQRQAFALVDNRLPLNAGWDTQLLAATLSELPEFDFTELGFTQRELAKVLAAAEPDGQPGGDTAPFQSMTFTVHDTQVKTIKRALAAAKKRGLHVDAVNENANGNALAAVCRAFLTGKANGRG